MLAILAGLTMTAASPPACDRATVSAAIDAAQAAMKRGDAAAAGAAIAPAAACTIDSGWTYGAHVLAADLAARRGDWAGVRALVADAGLHPETSLGARVQLLLMRADQGTGDAAAFAADRALTLVANDARLTAGGEKVETFRVGAASVAAYRTPVDQGAFHRVLEFVATPDDKGLYPVTITLTDDTSAASMMKALGGDKAASSHAWFVDLYTCAAHASLAPVAPPGGAEPGYAAVKARVVEVLSAPNAFAAAAPEHGACPTATWMLPGFGLPLHK